MSELIPPFVPWALLTHPGVSALLRPLAPRVLGGTREPGEGEPAEQREGLVSISLSFPLTSGP